MGLLGDNPRSINWLLMISFVLISLVPVSFLGSQMYKLAWDDAWREIHEKHRLLALNLGSPIQTFIQDHQSMLAMMTFAIQKVDQTDLESRQANVKLLKQSLQQIPEFQALILMDADEQAKIVIRENGTTQFDTDLYSNSPSYVDTVFNEEGQLSGAVFSEIDKKPTILITHPVLDVDENLIGVLIGELKISFIEELRKRIAFGEGGHSAIVDQSGRVVAHPNGKWMEEIRDISSIDIIQKVMVGETGVTEFYSPFVKEQMVAGYTGVPNIGWGIIVPQPKKEVENQVYAILSTQLLWAVIGFALAVVFAILIARWITRPIFKLARNAGNLIKQDYEGELPAIAKSSPMEIQQLDKSLRNLVNGLQSSREEISDLNVSLQHRVDEATEQLQDTNQQLRHALERSDEFMSFARHDLRKPIAVITDITDSLNNDLAQGIEDKDSLKDLLGLIQKTAKYMNHIVTDFLGKDASADDKMIIQKIESNINDVVQLITKSNERYANRKGIKLDVSLDKSIKHNYLDEARISQVCQNLIDNAIKFCKSGDEITISTHQHQNGIEVRVSDTGPGLTNDDLKKVFSKDVKLSNKPTGGEISTGVGLVICKHIIELHDGQIGVQNNPEHGCSFWFHLSHAA